MESTGCQKIQFWIGVTKSKYLKYGPTVDFEILYILES